MVGSQRPEQTSIDSSSDELPKFTYHSDPYYVPFAFVIVTEIENHDIFKEVLFQLFKSLIKPNNFTDYKIFAQADFIAHIAFLNTIPC